MAGRSRDFFELPMERPGVQKAPNEVAAFVQPLPSKPTYQTVVVGRRPG